MKNAKIIFLFIFLTLLISCTGKKNKDKENNIQTGDSGDSKKINDESKAIYEDLLKNFSVPTNTFDYYPRANYTPVSEEIINIILEQEEEYKKRFAELLFIQKVNFGVPGGDDYIVLWKGFKRGSYATDEICLYSISDKIENRYHIMLGIGLNNKEGVNPKIMENIPGIHLGNIGASVFDINGDGIDELFSYGFYGRGDWIQIMGYDAEENDVIDYCDGILFEAYKEDLGSAPVIFTRYKDKLGFLVFSLMWSRMPPVNLIDEYYAWYFFTWNSAAKKYENIGEYLPGGVDIKYNIHDYDINHFMNRIRIEALTNMEALVNLEEITANYPGGRSFKATLMDASTKTYFENVFDYDSDGKWRI